MEAQQTNGVLEEFRLEFLKCWNSVPNKGALIILLAGWFILFRQLGSSNLGYVHNPSLFAYMYNAFMGPASSVLEAEEGYSLFIPFIVGFLAWRKRRELLSVDFRPWWPGLLILAGSSLLHILAYSVQQPRLSVMAFFMGIFGIMGLVLGAQWLRACFFPYVLFVFCVPIGSFAEPVTFRLRLLVSQIVGFISHYLLAIDVLVQGNLLLDPTGHYQYEVAAACSGIRSLIATFALAVILAFISLRGPWKRFLLITCSLPLAVAGNVLRMLAIIIAAEIGGQEWGSYVHDGGPAGILSLLPYVPAFLGLIALQRYLGATAEQTAPAVANGLVPKQT